MRYFCAPVLMLSFCAGALAQTPDVPKAVVEQMAKDLAQLQRAVAEAQAQLQPGGSFAVGSGSAQMVTVTESTNLRARAAETSAPLFRVPKGRTLPVVNQANGWYAVQAESPVQGTITGWLRADAATPVGSGLAVRTSSNADAVFLTLTEHATRMKQNYQNNPYVSVSGFQVNVMPPGISINFDFKK